MKFNKQGLKRGNVCNVENYHFPEGVKSMFINGRYYSRKKKTEDKTKESEALERMQIREYGRQINEETRAKRK